jgi:hypothetical protein
MTALEERVDAELACGRHADLVPELGTLVATHPLRERLSGQLMLALYRAGRQAEALQVYRATRRELAEELGLEPGEALRRLEQAILRQDPELELEAPQRPLRAPPETARSLLVFPRRADALEALLRLAVTLTDVGSPRELIVARVVAAGELGEQTRALAKRAEALRDEGVAARTAAFSSPTPGDDVAQLATRQNVDLLLTEAGDAPLEGDAGAVLDRAPCDVALLIDAGGPPAAGPVVVPFGGAYHDWAALELGAAVASATGAPLRLIGAAADGRADARDASRLLADASLIVQRLARVVAEPQLTRPGREGLLALAAGAGLLVVGLSDGWREHGLGAIRRTLTSSPPAPTVLVRRGAARPGLAPEDPRTRFRWSLTAAGP